MLTCTPFTQVIRYTCIKAIMHNRHAIIIMASTCKKIVILIDICAFTLVLINFINFQLCKFLS